MVKFEEERFLDNVRGALALRGQIEAIVDTADGQCDNLCWLGIGGTWASCLQTTVHMKEHSAMEVFALNAAEYNTTGDRRVGARTFVVISSVTGTTEEMCTAVEKLPAAGAQHCRTLADVVHPGHLFDKTGGRKGPRRLHQLAGGIGRQRQVMALAKTKQPRFFLF